jgi:hypothetical protein
MPSIINATTTNGVVTSGDNSGSLQLATNNGTTAVTIDTSQNVAVGTTTPRTFSQGAVTPVFQIEKAGDARSSILRDSNDASGPVAYLAKTRGTTLNSNTVVQNGDTLGLVAFEGSDGSQLVRSSQIQAQVDGTPGSSAMPGRLLFSTTAAGAFSPTERMRITSGGNVGIGTATPAVALTVNGSSNPQIAVTSPAGTGAFLTIAAGGTTINSTSFDLIQDSSGNGYVYNRSNANLISATNNTERMRITSAGNIGIGTTSPAGRLDVTGSPVVNNAARTLLYVSDESSFAANNGGGITFRAKFNTAGDYVDAANIKGIKENATDGNNAGALAFSTHGAFTNPVERMRITSVGNVGIGTNNPSVGFEAAVQSKIVIGQSNTSGTLSVGNNLSGDSRPLFVENFSTGSTSNGMIYVNTYRNNTDFSFLQCWANNSGSQRAFIAGSGTFGSATGVYGGTSDARIKTNIVDATPKLSKLMQVRVVNYNRTDQDNAPKELGVIAQELETVFPGLVFEEELKDKDGNVICPDRKNVKYSIFVPILIKAMQEQQAIINELKTEIAAIKGAA